MANYYKILQVDPAADDDVIKAAYQRVISKFHPDKNPSPDAQQRSQDINEAYRVLSDPVQRAQYDKGRRPAAPPKAEARPADSMPRQERHKRERTEAALRHAKEDAEAALRAAQQEIQTAQYALRAAQSKAHEEHHKAQEEQRKRREAEDRLAAYEKTEALRRRMGLRGGGRAAAAAWFVGGGLSAAAAVLLFKFVSSLATQASQPLEPDMAVIKGGCFDMGSPENEPERTRFEDPRHQVCLRGFSLGKYEVTFDEYDRFARASGRALPEDNGWGRGRRPVINISWDEAKAYADWLSQQTGKHYRLPTEGEWEYAARAGTAAAFPGGGCINTALANYDGRTDYYYCGAKTGTYLGRTQAVGGYPANAWGLYDMQGNAWEWVADCWHENYQGAPEHGTAWQAGDHCSARVVRGGAWDDGPDALRSAFRNHWSAAGRYADLGFRLVQN